MAASFASFFILFLASTNAYFDLTLVHTGNLLSRMYDINAKNKHCSPEDAQARQCYGGMARASTKLKEIRANHPNTILVDGGNIFDTGAVWFNLFKGQPAAQIMNIMGYDVTTLGYNEFIPYRQVLENFLRNLTVDVVSSNTEFKFQTLTQRVQRSKVIQFPHNRKVGVIGYVTPKVSNTIQTDFVTFQSEREALSKVIRDLKRHHGVNIIIALGHSSTSTNEMLVEEFPDIDVWLWAFWPPFLYTGARPSTETPVHPYPYVKETKSGNKVLIVATPRYGKYLGQLNIRFDEEGQVLSFSGNPWLLDHSVKKDPVISEIVDNYWPDVIAYMQMKVADTLVDFPDIGNICTMRECNYGNLVTDALVEYGLGRMGGDLSLAPPIAVTNGGSLHGTFSSGGPINMSDFLMSMPYVNSLEIIKISGTTLKEMLEQSVIDYRNEDNKNYAFLQVSGLWVTYNLRRPKYQRVVDIMVRSFKDSAITRDPFGSHKVYKIITNHYLARGGDGYTMLKEVPAEDKLSIGGQDRDVVQDYIRRKSPLHHSIEGRIKFAPHKGGLCSGPQVCCSSWLNLLVVLLLDVCLNV